MSFVGHGFQGYAVCGHRAVARQPSMLGSGRVGTGAPAAPATGRPLDDARPAIGCGHFASLVLGAIAFGFVFITYPEFMTIVFDRETDLRDWIIAQKFEPIRGLDARVARRAPVGVHGLHHSDSRRAVGDHLSWRCFGDRDGASGPKMLSPKRRVPDLANSSEPPRIERIISVLHCFSGFNVSCSSACSCQSWAGVRGRSSSLSHCFRRITIIWKGNHDCVKSAFSPFQAESFH